MAREPYYTLVASLPLLPHFEEAQWLPLSRKQLDQRLAMLTPEHALQLRLSEELIKWQRQPITRTTEQVAINYRRIMPQIVEPALRDIVEYRLAQRSALVALRRRHLKMPVPASDEVWGVGPWLQLMTNNWDRADLGLTHLLPWLEEAAALLESGSALELERLLMNSVWTRLGRIAERAPFGLEPVIAFVFRWDMLQRWRTYNAEQAKVRFQKLVAEVTREQQQLFA